MSSIAPLSPRTRFTVQPGSEGLSPAAFIGAVAEMASLLGEDQGPYLCVLLQKSKLTVDAD